MSWHSAGSAEEAWAPNWCIQTVVLEKTLESPLYSKEIKKEMNPKVSPKGNQAWISIERTVAEDPILWPPNMKSWLSEKDPGVGEDWGQEERELAEDEKAR